MFEVKRQRYLRAEEHMLLQGIWPWSYDGSACKAVKDLSKSAAAKGCAGNAFSTTTALAASLASLICSSGWFLIAQRHHTSQIPDVPADIPDGSSQSLTKAALERGISSSEASSFAPFGLSLDQCRHQVVIFETPERAAKPQVAEVPRSACSKGQLDDWLGDFLDEEEKLFEEEPSTFEAFHQVKPVPTLGSECLRTPKTTKHEVQNGHLSSKKRKAPDHGKRQRRNQGGKDPGSHQPEVQREIPGSQQPEVQVQGEVPGSQQPEVQGEARPAKQRRMRFKQSGEAAGFGVAEIPKKAPQPCPAGEDEEDEPEKKRHKRGDSVSIAKKLAAVKQYEELVVKHGKKVGADKFYELRLPGLVGNKLHTYTYIILHSYIHTFIHACMLTCIQHAYMQTYYLHLPTILHTISYYNIRHNTTPCQCHTYISYMPYLPYLPYKVHADLQLHGDLLLSMVTCSVPGSLAAVETTNASSVFLTVRCGAQTGHGTRVGGDCINNGGILRLLKTAFSMPELWWFMRE